MAPEGRVTDSYDPDPPGARVAAILVIVSATEELVFIRRRRDGSHHGGQIAFPGGAQEMSDSSLCETALREAEEEIGLARADVEILGRLSPVYVGVSNFVVHPFVGYLPSVPAFAVQPSEVDEVIVLPLARFAQGRGELTVTRPSRIYRAPCYRVLGVEIWGATAMITAEFLQAYSESQRESHTTGG
jgi:8-oxo-dGTP pyrophosphatase MutT (NUDIX family)